MKKISSLVIFTSLLISSIAVADPQQRLTTIQNSVLALADVIKQGGNPESAATRVNMSVRACNNSWATVCQSYARKSTRDPINPQFQPCVSSWQNKCKQAVNLAGQEAGKKLKGPLKSTFIEKLNSALGHKQAQVDSRRLEVHATAEMLQDQNIQVQ